MFLVRLEFSDIVVIGVIFLMFLYMGVSTLCDWVSNLKRRNRDDS